MRELKSLYNARGIAISGYGMESDIQRSLEAGFSEHLVKPLDLKALELALQRVVHHG